MISLTAYGAAVLLGFLTAFQVTLFSVLLLQITWTLFCVIRVFQLRHAGSHQADAPQYDREAYGFALGGLIFFGRLTGWDRCAEPGCVSHGSPSRPGPDGLYTLEVEQAIDLERSSWISARVAESPAIRNRIMPRGLTVFAHTNPVYYLRDGAKVRETASIRYLQKYVRGAIHWLDTGARFRSPAEKDEALRNADQARRFYEKLER